MKKLRTHSEGFTVIELLVFIVVLVAIGAVAISNIRSLRAQNRDATSKAHINAIYYQLESYYEKNGSYPSTIDKTSLKGIDPASLKDTYNKTVNESGGIYVYKAVNCTETKCKSFELSAKLEKEAPYVKQSLNK